MIRCITCDEEGAALLAAAADMAHAALAARQVRVDPDGVIGKSLEMSRIKTQGLLAQLDGPTLAGWHELTNDQRGGAIAVMKVLISEASVNDKIALWPKLQAYVLLRGATVPVPYSVHARPDGHLPGSKVEKSERAAAQVEADMRKVRPEPGD